MPKIKKTWFSKLIKRFGEDVEKLYVLAEVYTGTTTLEKLFGTEHRHTL